MTKLEAWKLASGLLPRLSLTWQDHLMVGEALRLLQPRDDDKPAEPADPKAKEE